MSNQLIEAGVLALPKVESEGHPIEKDMASPKEVEPFPTQGSIGFLWRESWP